MRCRTILRVKKSSTLASDTLEMLLRGYVGRALANPIYSLKLVPTYLLTEAVLCPIYLNEKQPSTAAGQMRSFNMSNHSRLSALGARKRQAIQVINCKPT